MLHTNYVIQCTDHKSNTIGDFTYNKEQYERDGYFEATSPVFENLLDFFNYCRENKIQLNHLGV